jgi:ATP-dependent RNA helicase SUPV3L1/SUV3
MLERLSDLIRARVTWRPAPVQVSDGAASDADGVASATARGNEAPSGAIGDGSFRASPELMSVVGCSGEDFASILQALGFRRERRKLAAQAGTERDVAATPAFDEIWRPAKRKEGRHAGMGHGKGKPRLRAPRPEGQGHRVAKPREEKRERPRASDTSPFAVLAELRRNLAARRPEGS